MFNTKLFLHKLKNRKKINNFKKRWEEANSNKPKSKTVNIVDYSYIKENPSTLEMKDSEFEVNHWELKIKGNPFFIDDNICFADKIFKLKDIESVSPLDLRVGNKCVYCCLIKLECLTEYKLHFNSPIKRDNALNRLK